MQSSAIKELAARVNFTENKEEFIEILRRQYRLSELEISALWEVYDLAYFTDYFPDEFRTFLAKGESYTTISTKFRKPVGSIKSLVHRCSKNLQSKIGFDLWEAIKNNTVTERGLSDAIAALKRLSSYSKRLNMQYKDKLSVDLMPYINTYRGQHVDDYKFEIIMERFKSFSIPANEFLLKNMDKTLVSYGTYLLTTKPEDLNHQDRERRERLLAFMLLN